MILGSSLFLEVMLGEARHMQRHVSFDHVIFYEGTHLVLFLGVSLYVVSTPMQRQRQVSLAYIPQTSHTVIEDVLRPW